jgi:hypothetical protein
VLCDAADAFATFSRRDAPAHGRRVRRHRAGGGAALVGLWILKDL